MDNRSRADAVTASIASDRCVEHCAFLLRTRCDPGSKWAWPAEKAGQPMHSRKPVDLAARLSDIGLHVETYDVAEPGAGDEVLPAPLLHGYLDGETGEERLLLEAHYDAQPVQEENWETDPFGGEIDGDRLIGRGAVDSLGQLAAMIAAVEAISKSDVTLDGDIVLSTGPDGEYFGNGWKKAAEVEPDVDWIIGGEATYDVAAGAYEIATAHEAWFKFSIEITGETAHFGEKEQGINALVELGRLVDSLGYSGEGVEFTYEEWEYSDDRTDLPRMAILDSHSSYVSGLPNEASIKGWIEGIPGMTSESIERDLRRHVEALQDASDRTKTPAYDVSVVNLWPPSETPDDDPLVEALEGATTEVHGTPPETAVFRLLYSGAPAIARTIDEHIHGDPRAVTFGGGNPKLAHRDLEYVPIEGPGGLVEQAKIYARSAVSLLA